MIRNLSFPVIRSLYLNPNRNINPPSPKLLAIYRACAAILYLNDTKEYIDRVLKDIDRIVLIEDRPFDIKYLISLKTDD